MAFNPEQIAKAYVGAQGDIYDVFKEQAAQEAMQNKLLYEQHKERIAEKKRLQGLQNSALNSVQDLNDKLSLGSGTQADQLFSQEGNKLYGDMMSGDMKQLFNDSPTDWQNEYYRRYNGLKAKKDNYKEGINKIVKETDDLNKKYNNSLNKTALLNAAINLVAKDKDGNWRDSINADQSVLDALINGYVDLNGESLIDENGQIKDQAKSADVALNFIDPTENREAALKDISKLKQTKGNVSIIDPTTGFPGVVSATHYAWQKIDNNGRIKYDLENIKNAEGQQLPVVSQAGYDQVMAYPTIKRDVRLLQRQLENNPEFLQATAGLDDNQRKKLATTIWIEQNAPKDARIEKAELNPFFKEMMDMQYRRKKDQEEKVKDNLENLAYASFAPSFDPSGVSLANPNEIRTQKGIDFKNFYEITPKNGKTLITDGGTTVKVFRQYDPITKQWGKSYFMKQPTYNIQTGTSMNGRDFDLIKGPNGQDLEVGDLAEISNPQFFQKWFVPGDNKSSTSGLGKVIGVPDINAQATNTQPVNKETIGIFNNILPGSGSAPQGTQPLKKKVNNPTSKQNEDDEWINTILDFEDTKGSRAGGPMLYNGERNFGFNKHSDELIKIKDIGERKKRAVELFKKEVLPQVEHLPLKIRKRAGDLIYNGGQDPRTFLVYAAKGADSVPKDITERQKYWGQSYDKKEIDKLWNDNKDLVEKKLKDPDFIKRLDEIRSDYYNRLSDKEAYNNSWIHRLKIFDNK